MLQGDVLGPSNRLAPQQLPFQRQQAKLGRASHYPLACSVAQQAATLCSIASTAAQHVHHHMHMLHLLSGST